MSGYYRHAATTLKSAFSARSVAIRQKMPRLMKPGQVEHHEHLMFHPPFPVGLTAFATFGAATIGASVVVLCAKFA